MFSVLDHTIRKLETSASFALPGPPFGPNDGTSDSRTQRAARNYWFFDRTYFPPEMYHGYAKPARFHRDLVRICNTPGMHIIMAPRRHGKTASIKKYLLWTLLHQRQFAVIYAGTITTASNILDDITTLLRYNARLMHDYHPDIIEANSEQLTFIANGQQRRLIVASEGRSLRGATMRFLRPQFMVMDDIESRAVSLSSDAVEARYQALKEAYASLADDGTAIVLGNNFDERCLLNQLKHHSYLPDGWHIYEYKAWQDGKPLWPSRYPARSVDELRAMLSVTDDAEWLADYQQEPSPPDGIIFPRSYLTTYNGILPADARGVIYCDPNLALRGRGDTTAMVALFYAPSTDLYYIHDVRCRSYADSNELLTDLLQMRRWSPIIGFDGHVAQESFWTNLVRAWSRQHGQPYPAIIYCRYNVELLTKSAAVLWCQRRIRINEHLLGTPDGKRFISQVIAFHGKHAQSTDDAADALICAIELLSDRRPQASRRTTIINDYYAL